jgi:glycosyltransferase involved in cell wall biosynthesis
MKLLVLYEELAGYFLTCIGEFAKSRNCEVLVIRKEINAVAPFRFDIPEKVNLVSREGLSETEILATATAFQPDAIFCAGWGFAPYRAVCRKFRKKIPIALGFDNWWTGSTKQRISLALARLYFKKLFDTAFVPGTHQYAFARRLGFKDSAIKTGAYCCDFERFNTFFHNQAETKRREFPKRFIFAGRYEPEKGIETLWKAFLEIEADEREGWELWCLGKGSIAPVEHPAIKHFGFVQPDEIGPYLEKTGVFILPSLFEPWGVVTHEFAAAGFPLLLSEKVGAAETFLKDGENGYSIAPGNSESIKSAMQRIMKSDNARLLQMGERSNQLASQITPSKWSATLFSLFESA